MTTIIDPTLAIAFVYWGSLLKEDGEFSLAREKFRQAVEIDPSCAEAYLNLGSVYDMPGEEKDAIESFALQFKYVQILIKRLHC